MKIYHGLDQFSGVEHPVLTIGSFDGVHIGHKKIIDQLNEIAAAVGGESVMLTFAPHPRKVLDPNSNLHLITVMEEKIEKLAEAGLQHLIIYPFTKEFSSLEPEAYIQDLLVDGIHAKTIVVGYDHHYGKGRKGDFKLIEKLSEKYGYKVKEIPAKAIEDINVSSTKIRAAIEAGNIQLANQYLGWNYEFSGEVVTGNQKGRTIGFPTANLSIDSDKVIPQSGVFAALASVDGVWKKAMLNIGKKPTVASDNQISVEVHILDFSEDLYGQKISIILIDKLRDEKKFDSLDALAQQLAIDKSNTIKILSEL